MEGRVILTARKHMSVSVLQVTQERTASGLMPVPLNLVPMEVHVPCLDISSPASVSLATLARSVR